MTWKNEDPVAFQVVRNSDDMLKNVTMLIRRWEEYPEEHSDTIFNSLTTRGTKTDNRSCFAITMYNLAAPKWIKVDCNSNITTTVVCMRE